MRMVRTTTFTIVACLGLLGGLASAQTDVVLFGRVIGEDHTGPPPSTWSVKIAAEYSDNQVTPGRDSQSDLYAYRVFTGRTVRLLYQAPGYRYLKGEWLSELTDNRVRPDIVLEKIGPQMSWLSTSDPDAVEKDLAEQADLARRTGTTDVFLANYALQKKILVARPGYAIAVDSFERKNASFREVMKSGEALHLDLKLMAQLIDDDPASVASADAQSFLSLATMETLAPALRARAIDKLSTIKLPVDVSASIVNTMRSQSSSTQLPVRIAALSALKKLGTPADQPRIGPDLAKEPTWKLADVAEANWQSKPTTYISLAPGTDTDTDKALAAIATESTDPSKQVLAVRGLSNRTGDTAQKALVTILKKKDAPDVVRLEAVKSLATTGAKDGEAREVLKTLATQDPSADVRLAAAGAARQP
jgi:hypothetical protein